MSVVPDYKILYLDLETAPNLGYIWEKYEQNVLAYESEWYLLSFAYKWAHEKGAPKVYALPDFPAAYKLNPQNDRALLLKLWALLDEADLVVAHNGDRFDIRKANARFIFHHLPPPSPYKTVDTLKLARKYFKFNSNKLDDLAKHLGIGSKVKHEGFELWLRILRGDATAWPLMRKYNANDVVLLEKVHHRFRGWHSSHPNVNPEGTDRKCPSCGSPTQRRGWTRLASFKAQRYVCKRAACQRWSRGPLQKLDGALLR